MIAWKNQELLKLWPIVMKKTPVLNSSLNRLSDHFVAWSLLKSDNAQSILSWLQVNVSTDNHIFRCRQCDGFLDAEVLAGDSLKGSEGGDTMIGLRGLRRLLILHSNITHKPCQQFSIPAKLTLWAASSISPSTTPHLCTVIHSYPTSSSSTKSHPISLLSLYCSP